MAFQDCRGDLGGVMRLHERDPPCVMCWHRVMSGRHWIWLCEAIYALEDRVLPEHTLHCTRWREWYWCCLCEHCALAVALGGMVNGVYVGDLRIPARTGGAARPAPRSAENLALLMLWEDRNEFA